MLYLFGRSIPTRTIIFNLLFTLLYNKYTTRPKFLEQINTIIKFGLLSVILAVFWGITRDGLDAR